MSEKNNDERLKEIGEALHHYARTGEVRDCLLVAFDQRGFYIDRHDWNLDQFQARRLERQVMGLDQMIRVDKDGKRHLLGSFRVPGNHRLPLRPTHDPVEIDFSTIAGTLETASSKVIAPDLESVGWGVYLKNIEALEAPNLKYVGDNLEVLSALAITLPKLEKVAGSLRAKRASKLTLPELWEVGGDLLADEAHQIIAPRLVRVGATFKADKVIELKVPSLRWVGRRLRLDYLLPEEKLRGLVRKLETKSLKALDDYEQKIADSGKSPAPPSALSEMIHKEFVLRQVQELSSGSLDLA